MLEFLSKTPVQIALATLGTAVVATGSYLIGTRNGFQAGVQYVLEQVAAEKLDTNTEEQTN